MAELTQNEKRLLATLEKEKKADAPHLAGLLSTTPEAVVQWAYLLQDNGFAKVERTVAYRRREGLLTERAPRDATVREHRDGNNPGRYTEA